MAKPSLLMMSAYPSWDIEALEKNYDVHRYWEAQDKGGFLKKFGPEIRGIATDGGVGADKTLMDQLPKLEIIASFGVGADTIDLEEANKRGIRVTTTPDVLTNEVADFGIALMLAVARNIPRGDQFVRQGEWKTGTLPLATRLWGKRLGVVGLGHIGSAVAKRAAGFDMVIAYHNPEKRDDVTYHFYDDLLKLAEDSDFLITTVPGGDSTAKMINAGVLSALGADGFYINIARGSVVNEPDLIAALKNKTIKGAALDVFWNEPNINEAFFVLDNVVLEPHQASATLETRRAMGKLVRDNLDAYFSGKPLLTAVV